jgi:hypothetical protein
VRQTPLSDLLGTLLGTDLRTWVLTRRAAGTDWRTIAADLAERTGRGVSHESLRSWFADEPTERDTA